jgi:hypothetical protein
MYQLHMADTALMCLLQPFEFHLEKVEGLIPAPHSHLVVFSTIHAIAASFFATSAECNG